MTKQAFPHSPHAKRLSLLPQPALPWVAILGLVAFTALCFVVHAGSLIRIAFPVGSLLIGILLYRRYPVLYVGFTWWLWFLSAWVRRLIDYQSGWSEQSIVLLTPYLVTLVSFATFFRYMPKLYRQDGLPFLLSYTSVFYGLVIGLINSKFGLSSEVIDFGKAISATMGGYPSEPKSTPAGVIVSTLGWITPILFGFHLFVNWQYYPEYRQNIQRTFYWGILVMGTYGVVQYLMPPEWDRFWLRHAVEAGTTSFGIPEPFGIRVFSTMNAPGSFAIIMMAGLLLLLTEQGVLGFLVTGVGYLALLLSLVRSAWGGWFLGVLILFTSLKTRLQLRLIFFLLIVGIGIFFLAKIEPFSDVINARMQTLQDVQKDGSYQVRSEIYNRALSIVLFEPLGNGFGLFGMDSAFLDMLFAMGWLGVIPYLGGLILLLSKVLQFLNRRFDPFFSAASAISLATFAQLGLGNPLIGSSGLVLWSFLGIALAACNYYQHQRNVILLQK